ncbi:lipase family protein [Smaragdicoccus niigatensis]|uniref:lipase family protein n=1 Tax=Smaragdicoccus niigatensis TaxID=359359 RepID=UPI0003799A1D|nr:lipase family protein [Smaragdicoccus niigatensis]
MRSLRFRTFVTVAALGVGILSQMPAASAATALSELSPKAALAEASQAYEISYATIGSRGEAADGSGSVYLPKGTAPAGGWPVLAWAHGTVGIGDDCAPSRAGRTQRDIDYLNHWLKQGYAIVAPDYVGLGTPGIHPYLHGLSEAHAMVDGVGAAMDAVPELSHKWMVIGQSQGGQAALETASTATKWRSDLDFRGTVATGAAANLDMVFQLANPVIPNVGIPELTTIASYFIAGFRTARPDLNIDSYLSDVGKKVVADGETLCFDDMVKRVKGIGIGQLLKKDALPLREAMKQYLEVPTTGYDRPIFIGQGLLDTVVPAPLTAKLVTEMTASGQPVTYKTYPTDHSGTMAASLVDSTPFVKARLG